MKGLDRHGAAASGPLRSEKWRAARLNAPSPLHGSNGVAFGPDGRLYVAQFLAGQISAVDLATADIEVVVPADGPVRSPDDLAFGADGSMYIADLVPGRVWRRTPRGEYTLVSDRVAVPNGITCLGDRLFVNEIRMNGRLWELFPDGREPVVLTDGLALGNAMQIGPDGHLYYPHMVTGEVWRIPPDGGTPERVARDVHEPVAVRFDQGGVLTVLSRGEAGIVTRIDLHGSGARSVITSGVTGLDNAAFDAENRMFVSSFATGGVTEMHPYGRTREIVPRGLAGPFAVTVDLAGGVHAADHYRLVGLERRPSARAHAHTHLQFTHGAVADDGLLHTTSQYGEVRTHDPARGDTRVRASGLDRPAGITVAPDGRVVFAESGTGRVLTLEEGDEGDTLAVLAEGLARPVDVAFDSRGHAYVSDDLLGAVLRLDGGTAVTVVYGLDAPQGLAVLGDELFVVEAGSRRLLALSPVTGEYTVEAEDLPVAPPAGAVRPEPALFAHGMPGVPRPFAGLAAGPDGTLLLSANGEGTVLRLRRRHPATS
ncbi:SMP-30/gluconolactonase/LRE family protein [Streptomyces sp. NPDC003362]